MASKSWNYPSALISGEDNILIDRFAQKMNIADTYKGRKDKAVALNSFANKYKLELSQICFMGDDVNDIGALELAGFSGRTCERHESVKQKVNFVTAKAGGYGRCQRAYRFDFRKESIQ